MPPTPELDDAERAALAAELRQVILAKLQPPSPRAEPYPAPNPAGKPSHVLRKKRRPR